MSYAPATIADYFLDRASREGRALTPMQLIKLVYIAHGWHLAHLDEPLINEKVQAWKFGPVIGTLYDELKRFGRGAVSGKLYAFPKPIAASTQGLLDSVWNAYSRYSGLQLSSMTHQPNTPWHNVWNNGGARVLGAHIDNGAIREHYLKKLEERQANVSA